MICFGYPGAVKSYGVARTGGRNLMIGTVGTFFLERLSFDFIIQTVSYYFLERLYTCCFLPAVIQESIH